MAQTAIRLKMSVIRALGLEMNEERPDIGVKTKHIVQCFHGGYQGRLLGLLKFHFVFHLTKLSDILSYENTEIQISTFYRLLHVRQQNDFCPIWKKILKGLNFA